jgi:gliding motility-associated-like protein
VKAFLFTLFIFLVNSIAAQVEEIETISVDIDIATQKVNIKWKPFSDLSNLDWYLIFKEVIKEGNPPFLSDHYLFPVSKFKTDTSFFYPEALDSSIKFLVSAQKGPIPHERGTPYNYKNKSQTICCKTEYDSCNSNLIIRWNHYTGWGPKSSNYSGNVKEYQVFDCIKNEMIAVKSDTIDTVHNVLQNTAYKYYIKAIQQSNNTIFSHSNIDSIYTGATLKPNFINAQTASYIGNVVELNYEIDITSKMNHYALYRSTSEDGNYNQIADYPNVIISPFIVNDANPPNTNAYYKLNVINKCNTAVMTSNKSTAIVPNIDINNKIVTITWDKYIDWPKGVSEYRVFRKIDNESYSLVQSVNPSSSLIYHDDLNQFIGTQKKGVFWYYIESESSETNKISKSKEVLIDLSGEVYMPNAFTPDGNNQNDFFTASFAFSPANFKMYIYDRYGFKLFETSNFLKGWNGLLSDRKKAPEGAYIYLIYFTTGNGKKIEKKGSFTLIYPPN